MTVSAVNSEAHAEAVGHDHEHSGHRPVAGEAAEHGEHERADGAAEGGHGVGHPEEEHRSQGAGPPAPIEAGGDESQLASEQERHAEADEDEADDDAEVTDDVGHPFASGADHEAEDGEHRDEAGRHRRAHHERPGHAGPGRLITVWVLAALEPEEVGR